MAGKEQKEQITLGGEDLSRLQQMLEEALPRLKMERTDVLRAQLFVEETLLRWQEQFGPQAQVEVSVGLRWRQPTVTLVLAGQPYNPLQEEGELGEWSRMLLSNIGLQGEYSYHSGKNRVRISLRRARKKPAVVLLGSMAAAIVLHLLGTAVLPEGVMQQAQAAVFQPIYDMFFRIVNAVSGPAILLSVLVAVYGIGNAAVHGETGKILVRRLLGGAFMLTVLAGVVCLPLYTFTIKGGLFSAADISGVLNLLLNFVPNDILTPILTSDPPALFLLGLVLGYALLRLGSRGDTVVRLANQCNQISQIVLEWIGVLAPGFIFVILLFRGTADIFVQLWKPALLFVGVSVLLLAVAGLITGLQCGISARQLMKKLWPCFRAVLKTASPTAVYGEINTCCQKRLGVSGTLSDYGIPLGLVVYMPGTGISLLVLTYQMAHLYEVNVSGMWVVYAVLLAALLSIASPPIPGGNLIVYAAMFAYLGIPAEGLIFVLVGDTLFNFPAAAVNVTLLQMALLRQGHRMGLADPNG